ncbi:MAG: hypothetical protein COU90_02785 [Candidatus Ryanbacteria bacterium CG10_big_fil_rev_8_21_14_0_10_43_42]|uniref:Uncharacterized protein n=1 Tax=Candidatus Ryanbacteria bacterium CG10_big_fil_rev_8_21_14_0_10_43_42 TaxID=1974864 RepID=A0A2M8KWU4_9BACT|nr:MAG: hypothetical protein COU90_02785 [Candidatus Ryanbacteria bacterium CG10_big_fil_rev_8_21_14_0_10_43_42]
MDLLFLDDDCPLRGMFIGNFLSIGNHNILRSVSIYQSAAFYLICQCQRFFYQLIFYGISPFYFIY